MLAYGKEGENDLEINRFASYPYVQPIGDVWIGSVSGGTVTVVTGDIGSIAVEFGNGVGVTVSVLVAVTGAGAEAEAGSIAGVVTTTGLDAPAV